MRKKTIDRESKDLLPPIEKGTNDPPEADPTRDDHRDDHRDDENTMRLNSNIANAIAAVGEASPEAKRKILSGEIYISKKDLEELSFLPMREVEAIAAEIVEGTYEGSRPGMPASAYVERTAGDEQRNDEQRKDGHREEDGTIPNRLQPLNAYIRNTAANIISGLSVMTNEDERSQLKIALRSCIETLENLYLMI